MSNNRKRIMGFNVTADIPAVPPEPETKVDYVNMALDAYFQGYRPPTDERDGPIEVMTSKEIQDDIKDIVTASVSTITEYMVAHGYKLICPSGGRLVWELVYGVRSPL